MTLKPAFTPVPFLLPTIKAYATETAIEEGKHVSFCRARWGEGGLDAEHRPVQLLQRTGDAGRVGRGV